MLFLLFRYAFFSVVNLLMFLIPMILAVMFLPETVVANDTFNVIYGLVFIAFIGLVGFVVHHQVPDNAGFIQGWKMALLSIKMHLTFGRS